MKNSIKVGLNNSKWTIVFGLPINEKDGALLQGCCDNRSKTITVNAFADDFETLDILIHEMLHAICWSKPESWVNKRATEFAKILWKLGYQRLPILSEGTEKKRVRRSKATRRKRKSKSN